MGAPAIVWLRDGVGYVEPAAASMARLEARLGRRHDCNSSYRDYNTQLSMWRAWQAYMAGTGPHPGHSRALHPDASMHCQGLADDSDDWTTPGYIALAEEYGWIRTAADDPTERHHFEYQSWRDQHRHEGWPATSGAVPFPTEEEDMTQEQVDQIKDIAAGVPGAGAWLVRYAKSIEFGNVYALYENARGARFRVIVVQPAELAALGADIAQVPSAELQRWAPVDRDGVVFHPGEQVGFARSAATGNVFRLFRDNRGGQARQLITDPTERDQLGEVAEQSQSALWAYAPINQ
jgi:hypothetical protein